MVCPPLALGIQRPRGELSEIHRNALIRTPQGTVGGLWSTGIKMPFLFVPLRMFLEKKCKECASSVSAEKEIELHMFGKETVFFFFFFWPCGMACGILVPQPGNEPGPAAMEAQSPNHWTTREVLRVYFLTVFY